MTTTRARRAIRTAAALLFGASLAWGVAAAPPPTAPARYVVEVELDPGARTLRATATITLDDAAAAELLLDNRLAVRALDGARRAPAAPGARAQRLTIPAGAPGRSVRVEWGGTLHPTPADLLHRDTLGARASGLDPRGSFLPAASLWYPLLARDGAPLLHAWRLRLALPEGQRGLVAGTLVGEHSEAGRGVAEFDFPAPGEGMDLMAGPYRVDERTMRSADGRALALRTYFHAELAPLADGYLDSVREFIELYEGWIGPYPFDGFSVVSSPTPTGFGMPSLTYLGIDVLRLPFIRATSLGHEVLHNWWGNGVYPDYARGNWSEGLTTFMADYAYALREGADKAHEMRLAWLRELSAIAPGDDRPLAEFTARHHGIARAVGYGKAAMLFVMLHDRIGADAFDRAVRRFWAEHRFRVAGWEALRAAFEAEAGEPLGPFFEQWLARTGLPEVRLEAAMHEDDRVVVTVAQSAPAYEIDLPLRLEGTDGTVTHRVRLDGTHRAVALDAPAGAHAVTLDPEHRLLRRLAPDEAPPILREVQLDRRAALVALVEAAQRTAAHELAARLFDHRPLAHDAARAPGAAPLLVVGTDEAIAAWLARHDLPAAPPEVAGRGDVRLWTLRLPSGAPAALVAVGDAEALRSALRPLPHYGRQSWLVIEAGRALERGIWPTQPAQLDIAAPR